MRSFFVGISAIYLVVGSALAQTPSTSSPALSLDQQNKISEIVTNRTPQPINHINFALQRDAVIPADVSLQKLPAEAESVAPELKGYSYLAVEELVAIVDTGSRKVVSVMQRMRRQESTGAAKWTDLLPCKAGTSLIARGKRRLPSRRLGVQALRNTRFFARIAHDRTEACHITHSRPVYRCRCARVDCHGRRFARPSPIGFRHCCHRNNGRRSAADRFRLCPHRAG